MEESRSNQPGNDDEVYYTLADVCKTLGISRTTLWRKRKSALIFIRSEGTVRIKKSDFERFLKSREIHPQPSAACPPGHLPTSEGPKAKTSSTDQPPPNQNADEQQIPPRS